jgi:hypothetical protein
VIAFINSVFPILLYLAYRFSRLACAFRSLNDILSRYEPLRNTFRDPPVLSRAKEPIRVPYGDLIVNERVNVTSVHLCSFKIDLARGDESTM